MHPLIGILAGVSQLIQVVRMDGGGMISIGLLTFEGIIESRGPP